jgi:hypothetical protein
MWNGLPPLGRPVHAYLKSEYLLSRKEDNPDLRGFDPDPAALPEFYVEQPAPPKPRDLTPDAPAPTSPTVPPSGMSDKMKMMMVPTKPPLPPVEPEPAPKTEEE